VEVKKEEKEEEDVKKKIISEFKQG